MYFLLKITLSRKASMDNRKAVCGCVPLKFYLLKQNRDLALGQ